MQRVWEGAVGLALVFALNAAPAWAAGASVQPTNGVEPGVTIDEGSPAAKEYALALWQARRTGSRGGRTSSSEAPFGAGITPPSSGAGGGPGGRSRSPHGTGGAGKSGASSESARAPATLPTAVLRAARSAASGGESSLLALLGGGVAILVLGALGGVVLRHNRRPPSHA